MVTCWDAVIKINPFDWTWLAIGISTLQVSSGHLIDLSLNTSWISPTLTQVLKFPTYIFWLLFACLLSFCFIIVSVVAAIDNAAVDFVVAVFVTVFDVVAATVPVAVGAVDVISVVLLLLLLLTVSN